MPIILALLRSIGAARVRSRCAAIAHWAASDLSHLPNEARLARCRYGYRRRTSLQAADALEDPRRKAAGIARAMALSFGPRLRAEIAAMHAAARGVSQGSEVVRRRIAVFGRWICGKCNRPDEPARRLLDVGRDAARVAFGPVPVETVETVDISAAAGFSDCRAEMVCRLKRGLELG